MIITISRIAAGDRIVTLHVTAKGSGLKYQWYRRYGADDTWKAWNG